MVDLVQLVLNINSLKGMMSENEFKLFLDRIIPNLIEYKNKK